MYITLFPCPMCASAIVQSRIKKIVIGAPTTDEKNKKIVDLIFEGNNTSPKIEVVENILEEECKNILSEFFKKKENSIITKDVLLSEVYLLINYIDLK